MLDKRECKLNDKCFNCGKDIRIKRRKKGSIYHCIYCGREVITKVGKDDDVIIYEGEEQNDRL